MTFKKLGMAKLLRELSLTPAQRKAFREKLAAIGKS